MSAWQEAQFLAEEGEGFCAWRKMGIRRRESGRRNLVARMRGMIGFVQGVVCADLDDAARSG
jgi:hypothetical protein